jgi:hypothetical protein
MSEEEQPFRSAENDAYYREDSYEFARRNFRKYPRAHLVRGRVPDTLNSVGRHRRSQLPCPRHEHCCTGSGGTRVLLA